MEGHAHPDVRPDRPRIFGIGLNKTGTSSFDKAMTILGFESLHDGGAEIHEAVKRVIDEGAPLLSNLDQRFDVFSDIGLLSRRFRLLDSQYAGSRFVLTMRPFDQWLDSRKRHVQRNIALKEAGEYHSSFLVIDEEKWTNEWNVHIEACVQVFRRPRRLSRGRPHEQPGVGTAVPVSRSRRARGAVPLGQPRQSTPRARCRRKTAPALTYAPSVSARPRMVKSLPVMIVAMILVAFVAASCSSNSRGPKTTGTANSSKLVATDVAKDIGMGFATGGHTHGDNCVADFDGDGTLDLLLSKHEGVWPLLRGLPNGKFEPITGASTPTPETATAVRPPTSTVTGSTSTSHRQRVEARAGRRRSCGSNSPTTPSSTRRRSGESATPTGGAASRSC